MRSPKAVVLLPKSLGYPPGFEEVPALVDVFVTQSEDEAAEHLIEAEIYFQWDFGSRVLGKAPRLSKLRWVHAASLGVDTIMTDRIVNSAVEVSNTRGVYEYPIAEYVLGLLLYWLKDFGGTSRLQRERRWKWRPTDTARGKRVIIMGPGAVGTEIRKLLSAIGMDIVLVGRAARPATQEGPPVYAIESLIELLPSADAVVLALPLSDATRNFMDSVRFSQMRDGAMLINIGRGGLVDETALLAALDSGKVGFAGLDVFVNEPLPAASTLWERNNVFVSPHMSGDVHGWRDQVSAIFVAHLKDWLAGRPLPNAVDKAKFATRG